MWFCKVYHDDLCWYVSSDQHKSLVKIHCGASCSWKQAYTYKPCSKFPPWSQARESPGFSADMRVLREARCSVSLPSGKTLCIVFSPSSVFLCPLSVTLICAFTEWRSCPQPVLVLGYLGKRTDPRIERTPLDTFFRDTLNVRFTLAVLLSFFSWNKNKW